MVIQIWYSNKWFQILKRCHLKTSIFLKLLNNGTKLVYGHYHVLLPFKNQDVCFQNNKSQMMKRPNNCERTFPRNLSFLRIINSVLKICLKGITQESPSKLKKMGNASISFIIVCIIRQNKKRSGWLLIMVQSTEKFQSTIN